MLTKLELCEEVIDNEVEMQVFQQTSKYFYWGNIEPIISGWVYDNVGLPIMELIREVLGAY